MLLEFIKPLSITPCKLGDALIIQTDETTPFDFKLRIKDMDGSLLYGPASPDLTRDSVHYWFIAASSTYGITTSLTYYEITISDEITNDYADERKIIYVNDDYSFEQYIIRSCGLAGHNCRRYNHTWTRGQLTSFYVKIYETAAKLSAAVAGTSDDYLAEYKITITYDQNYNRATLSSVKQ